MTRDAHCFPLRTGKQCNAHERTTKPIKTSEGRRRNTQRHVAKFQSIQKLITKKRMGSCINRFHTNRTVRIQHVHHMFSKNLLAMGGISDTEYLHQHYTIVQTQSEDLEDDGPGRQPDAVTTDTHAFLAANTT
jgi:hypothetical protein